MRCKIETYRNILRDNQTPRKRNIMKLIGFFEKHIAIKIVFINKRLISEHD